MQHVSPSSLADLPSRIAYLSSFLDLNVSDAEALQAAKPLVAPLIPTILDAVYVKLLSFDITAQAFVPKNTDFEGKVVSNVQELTMEHPQIALRKDFLKVSLPQSNSFLWSRNLHPPGWSVNELRTPELPRQTRLDSRFVAEQSVLGVPEQRRYNAYRQARFQASGEAS